jgi:hypothetical protein
MSINLVCFTGNVGKLQYRAAGQPTKSGKVLSFPSLSIPIRIPDDQFTVSGSAGVALVKQELWVDIGVPTRRDKSADEEKIFALAERIQNGYAYGLIAGGNITEWGNPVRRQVRVPFNGLSVSPKPLVNLNRITLMGQVVQEGENLLIVEESYQVKGEWRSRTIPVLVTGRLDKLKGRTVLVYGRLAARSYTGDPEIYTIAQPEEIFAV